MSETVEWHANYTTMPLARWLEDAYQLVIRLEVIFGVPLFLGNIYFAMRFAKISVFSANFRALMVIINFSASVLVVAYPLVKPEFLDPEVYSIEMGHYKMAAFIYSVHVVLRILLFLFGAKYLFFTVERQFAMKNFADYERRNSCWAFKLIGIVTLIFTVVNLIRIQLILEATESMPVDQRFIDAFSLERQPLDYLLFYSCLGASMIITGQQIIQMRRKIKTRQHNSSSLSESFQIRQTKILLKTLIPLYFMHCTLCVMSTTGYFIGIVDYFDKGTVEAPLYRTLLNADYFFGTLYITATTIFMTWSIKPMRRLLLADLEKWLGIRVEFPDDKLDIQERQVEANHHFEYLKDAWGQPKAEKSAKLRLQPSKVSPEYI